MSQEESVKSQEVLSAANEVVTLILRYMHSKRPIKQVDLIGNLPFKPSRKDLKEIMEETKRKLLEIRLQLITVENSSVKSYIIVDKDLPLPGSHELVPVEERCDYVLLLLILSFIFMKEGVVTEVDLWVHLKKLKILNELKPVHIFFGDVKKKITGQFVDMLYLKYIKAHSNEISNEFLWGQRAELEISKRHILEFVCTFGYNGKVKPENWASQYKKVLSE